MTKQNTYRLERNKKYDLRNYNGHANVVVLFDGYKGRDHSEVRLVPLQGAPEETGSELILPRAALTLEGKILNYQGGRA